MMFDSMRWSEELLEGNHNSNSSNSPSAASAPTIKNHSVTHLGQYLYCFGGYDGRRNHNSLLLYHLSEKRWIRPQHAGENNSGAIDGSASSSFSTLHHHPLHSQNSSSSSSPENAIVMQGSPPPGRNGHSATLAADDEDLEEGNGRIIIIGGWLGTGPLAASDMHVLDVSRGGRQLTWFQPAVKGLPPGPCNMHTADFVRTMRAVLVFRGGNGREYLNDLHALEIDTFTWRKVETKGAIPQQRANHSSSVLEGDDGVAELFIFGGWNGGERLNDIHILNTETSTWTCPRVGGVLPHPRAGMTLTALRGRLYLFGGSGTSAKCFQDLQILDRQQMAWLDVTQSDEGQTQSSSSQGHHAVGSNSDEDVLFRFGGNNLEGSMAGAQNHLYRDDSEQPHPHPVQYGEDVMAIDQVQDGSDRRSSFTLSRVSDWRSRDSTGINSSQASRPLLQRQQPHLRHSSLLSSPNPNDEDVPPTVVVRGRGPGRRAGHTATAVNRKIFFMGGSCGSDYLSDFFVLDTDPPPRAMVSEATSLQLLERRLRHFFNDEEFADVVFLVQGHRVYGHKMVLSIVSDCFRAMFTTGFRESAACEIEIPDCSYAGFLAVMEYIYTAKLPSCILESSDERDGHLLRVVEMLELADRFFLDHLKQICETLLQPSVNAETVEYLLAVSQKTNALQLQAVCEHFQRNREST